MGKTKKSAKAPISEKIPVCEECWAYMHTRYDEKGNKTDVAEECPIGIHIRTKAEKCGSRHHNKDKVNADAN